MHALRYADMHRKCIPVWLKGERKGLLEESDNKFHEGEFSGKSHHVSDTVSQGNKRAAENTRRVGGSYYHIAISLSVAN